MKKYIKNNLSNLLLATILLLGFALRIHTLTDIPAGFFGDEASIGYNAYTILNTGKDEYGVTLPVFFRAFGEYKSPIQIYSTVPLIAIFGFNEFAVRLTSVLFGVLSIFAIYLFVTELFHTNKSSVWIGLTAALLLAISPWHIQFSRIAFELMPYVCFTLFGMYFFYKSQSNSKHIYLSVTLFVLALYSYFAARLFIPLIGISLAALHYRFFLRNIKKSIVMILLLAILLLPFIQNTFFSNISSRWQEMSVFAHPPTNQTVISKIGQTYLYHFSLDYLFYKGDIDMPGQNISRHSIHGMGELYLFQLPFILLGFLYLIKKKYYKQLLLLLLWLILYPIPSSLTFDVHPQASRSIIGVVPFQILTALGIIAYFDIFKTKRFWRISSFLTLLLLTLLSLLHFIFLYFVQYPLYSSGYLGWQSGPREIIKYFVQNETRYDNFYIQGEFNAPQIFFKFYAPNGCSKCLLGTPSESYDPNRKQLFAVTPAYLTNNPTLRFSIKKIIYYPNNIIAFVIGEVN